MSQGDTIAVTETVDGGGVWPLLSDDFHTSLKQKNCWALPQKASLGPPPRITASIHASLAHPKMARITSDSACCADLTRKWPE